MRHSCKLHHISYAVSDTDKSLKVFKKLYPKVVLYKCPEPSQKVKVTYLVAKGIEGMVELVEPSEKGSPIDSLLKKSTCVMYHVCYHVDDFDYWLTKLIRSGYFQITSPFLSNYGKGNWASHLFNPNSGVIEIIGKRNETKTRKYKG